MERLDPRRREGRDLFESVQSFVGDLTQIPPAGLIELLEFQIDGVQVEEGLGLDPCVKAPEPCVLPQ